MDGQPEHNTNGRSDSTVPPEPRESNTPQCLVCLVKLGEDGRPASDWVTPSRCSITGHQECMLEWVSSLESAGRPLVCPQCLDPIVLEEPADPVVAVNKALHKGFSRVAKPVVGAALASGTGAGLLSYGLAAMMVFAGPADVVRFLGRGGVIGRSLRLLVPICVGPYLVLDAAFPVLMDSVLLPVAAVVGVSCLSSARGRRGC